LPQAAEAVERAVAAVLAAGYRTPDIASTGTTVVDTTTMGERIAAALEESDGETADKVPRPSGPSGSR